MTLRGANEGSTEYRASYRGNTIHFWDSRGVDMFTTVFKCFLNQLQPSNHLQRQNYLVLIVVTSIFKHDFAKRLVSRGKLFGSRFWKWVRANISPSVWIRHILSLHMLLPSEFAQTILFQTHRSRRCSLGYRQNTKGPVVKDSVPPPSSSDHVEELNIKMWRDCGRCHSIPS